MRSLVGAALALLAAAALGLPGGRLVARHRPAALPRDLLGQWLGAGRGALSGQMLERADRYFHGGVGHTEACFAASGEALAEPEEHGDHDDHAGHETHGQEGVLPDWWSRLNAQVRPREHLHTQGAREDREVLPWLWAAVRADPHNVRAYEVGGYWLGKRLGRTREAFALLAEGLARNPGAYSLCTVRGDLCLVPLNDRGAAREAYAEAWERWSARAGADASPELRWDGAGIQLMLAALAEGADARASALAHCAAARRLGADSPALLARVAALEKRLGLGEPARP